MSTHKDEDKSHEGGRGHPQAEHGHKADAPQAGHEKPPEPTHQVGSEPPKAQDAPKSDVQQKTKDFDPPKGAHGA